MLTAILFIIYKDKSTTEVSYKSKEIFIVLGIGIWFS